MSAPVEQKAELQPVHRVFLGELFVFVFFFAGAMSVLVGPMRLPLLFSSVMVLASAMVSGFTFLWFAFVTPTKRTEPRYGYMILSLLPTLVMSPIFFLIANYASQATDEPMRQKPATEGRLRWLEIINVRKSGPISAQLIGEDARQRAIQLFAEEIAALIEELDKHDFVDRGVINTRQCYVRLGAEKEVAVELIFESDVANTSTPGTYRFLAVLTNIKPGSSDEFFSNKDRWPIVLQDKLSNGWNRNMSARRKAESGSQESVVE